MPHREAQDQAVNSDPIKIALGPLLYFWDAEAVRAFYERMATTAVDTVYLGEVVCAKRRALRLPDWLEIAARLRDAGKEVVLSTLALIEAESDLATLRRWSGNGDFLVEANDMAAVNIMAGRVKFVAGPHLNVYNRGTLELLAAAGAVRWVPPVELDQESITRLHNERPPGVETELFAYGRLPLSLSARCFTARAHNLPKDRCEFRCADYADGMLLRTREEEPFLVINGIQMQSARHYNLLPRIAQLRALGIDALRLSPHSGDMEAVIAAFDAGRHGRVAGDAPAGVAPACDGFWTAGAGLDWGQEP